jgi:predicted secreted protein
VSIALEENGSTGYLWSQRAAEGSEIQDFKVESGAFPFDELPSITEALIGTGSIRHYTIDALKPGTIIFELRRPWLSLSEPPLRKVTITIE